MIPLNYLSGCGSTPDWGEMVVSLIQVGQVGRPAKDAMLLLECGNSR